ncbi:hypothetical protein [Ursidibacter maritimus]|nr:hypothetical protein [Ursidibacter maritimus]
MKKIFIIALALFISACSLGGSVSAGGGSNGMGVGLGIGTGIRF